MDKRKTPTNRTADALDSRRNKGSLLSGNDIRVLDLLSNGCYSVIEITNILNIPDPRSNVRYLRNAGYLIGDYWVKGDFSRHKMYFYKG